MDASNLLKPALARGELHCIGATTLDEYRKYVEKDPALQRRFQPVFVGEPTVEDTISILRGLKEKYELHHGVRITDGALVAAATLSNRYITDRFLPDKAIDLMDEAASRLRMEVESKPEEIEKLDRRIIQLKIEREALKKETDAASQGPARHAGGRARRARAAIGRADHALAGREGQDRRRGQDQGAARRRAARARAGAARAAISPRRASFTTAASPRSRSSSPRPQAATSGAMLREEVTAEDIAGVVVALDRHSGRPDAGRRAREVARAWKQAIGKRVIGQERGGRGGQPRGPPRPRRPAGSEPAARLASCSSARPASARPSSPRRSPNSCSTTTTRWSASTCREFMEKHSGRPADRRAAGLCRL